MTNSSTGRLRLPLAVRASAIIAQVLALGAALTAFDLVLAAVDWEHHHRADYIREHGPTFASQGFLWISAGIAAAVTLLLVTGANRALRGVTDVHLIAALVAATAVIGSGLWTGSGVLATVLRLILPGVALALLLIGRVRPKN
jgi:hypothetical protein